MKFQYDELRFPLLRHGYPASHPCASYRCHTSMIVTTLELLATIFIRSFPFFNPILQQEQTLYTTPKPLIKPQLPATPNDAIRQISYGSHSILFSAITVAVITAYLAPSPCMQQWDNICMVIENDSRSMFRSTFLCVGEVLGNGVKRLLEFLMRFPFNSPIFSSAITVASSTTRPLMLYGERRCNYDFWELTSI